MARRFGPLPLRFEDYLDDFAHRPIAAGARADVMGCALHLDRGVGHRDGQARALQQGKVRKIIANVGDFRLARTAGAQECGRNTRYEL